MKLKLLRPGGINANQIDTDFRGCSTNQLLFNILKLEWRTNSLIKFVNSMSYPKILNCSSKEIETEIYNSELGIIDIFELLPYDSPINYSLNMLTRDNYIYNAKQTRVKVYENVTDTDFFRYSADEVKKNMLSTSVPIGVYEFYKNELEKIDDFVAELKQVNEAMFALQDWLNGCSKKVAKTRETVVPKNIESEIYVRHLRDYLAHRDEIQSKDSVENLSQLESFIQSKKIMPKVKFIKNLNGLEYPYLALLGFQFLEFENSWIKDLNENYKNIGFRIDISEIDYEGE